MTELQIDLFKNGCHVKTIIKDSTYTFNWTVENFSKFPLGTEKTSPTFHPLPNRTFYAKLMLPESSNGSLEFYHISETGIEVSRVKHIVSIVNSAGQVVLSHTKTYKYIGNNSYCDVLPTCATVLKTAREENVLIVKCVMEFFGEDNTDTYYYNTHSKPSVPLLDGLSALSKDLQAMFDTSMHADINLKVGDSVMHVHKSVMCARSSVFARMFETPMGESEKNVVDITDLDLPVLKHLVSYLYTGVLAKDDFESVYALYYAADKYDVPILRKTCSDVLLSQLDVENACRVLALADRHSDVEFKNSVMDFVKFYFNKVLGTEAWKELVGNGTGLAIEVITLYGEKMLIQVDQSDPSEINAVNLV